MDAPHIVLIVTLIIGVQAAVWSLIFYRMARQSKAIRAETWRSGEKIVLGPVRANYQGWNRRFGVSKTIGTLVLLDRRLLFKRPVGSDISINLTDIAEASDTVAYLSLKHTFGDYLALKLRDNTETVFLVRDRNQWLEAIRVRIPG